MMDGAMMAIACPRLEWDPSLTGDHCDETFVAELCERLRSLNQVALEALSVARMGGAPAEVVEALDRRRSNARWIGGKS